MLRKPGVVGRALNGKIERHLQSQIRAGSHQAPKVLERPKLGMHGVMTALDRANGVGTTRVTGFATQRIIAALAVRATDRMDGSEIKHIEA
jgi:hypothetical protein